MNEGTRVSAAVVALSLSWDGTQACISVALALAVRVGSSHNVSVVKNVSGGFFRADVIHSPASENA